MPRFAICHDGCVGCLWLMGGDRIAKAARIVCRHFLLS